MLSIVEKNVIFSKTFDFSAIFTDFLRKNPKNEQNLNFSTLLLVSTHARPLGRDIFYQGGRMPWEKLVTLIVTIVTILTEDVGNQPKR